jgi:uncharacterized protein (DUF849 family)
VIQAALNGGRLALDAAQLARDAREAVDAGAGSLHVHPRDAAGRESFSLGPVAGVVGAIREACGPVEVGVTTAEWIGPDGPEEIAAWIDPLPDMASVNLSEVRHLEVMGALLWRGVAIEAGVWSVSDVEALAHSGVADLCRRVLVEAQPGPDQVAQAEAIDAALDEADIALPRVHHGEDAGTWDVVRRALALGHDVRIGLEDTATLPDGTPAGSNAELVAAVRALQIRPAG